MYNDDRFIRISSTDTGRMLRTHIYRGSEFQSCILEGFDLNVYK